MLRLAPQTDEARIVRTVDALPRSPVLSKDSTVTAHSIEACAAPGRLKQLHALTDGPTTRKPTRALQRLAGAQVQRMEDVARVEG